MICTNSANTNSLSEAKLVVNCDVPSRYLKCTPGWVENWMYNIHMRYNIGIALLYYEICLALYWHTNVLKMLHTHTDLLIYWKCYICILTYKCIENATYAYWECTSN